MPKMHLVLESGGEFVVGDETFLCREGDMLRHHSELQHTIRNPGMAHAIYLTLLTPPTLI